MKRFGVLIAILLGLAIIAAGALFWWQQAVGEDPAFFEKEIAAFEVIDKNHMPDRNGILFVGSSSIRFWNTLKEDMAPLPIIRRGFGGAHMSHVLHNFYRIVSPYEPKAVVVFVGGNDVASGKSVEQIGQDYQKFIEFMRSELPNADIWILSMKPSKLRWKQWREMGGINEVFRGLAEQHSNIYFVNTGDTLLGEEGKPDDVYILDGLHLNAEGYKRWTKKLKPLLMSAYP